MSNATVHVTPFKQLSSELGQLMDPKLWNNEICAIALITLLIYIQVKWILVDHAEKLKTKSERDALVLEERLQNYETRLTVFQEGIQKETIHALEKGALGHLESEIELHQKSQEERFAEFKDEMVRIQEIHEQDMINIHKHTMETQHVLEGPFKELATTEHKLSAATAARLRHQLKTGGLWGKDLRELQELSRAADEREKAWLKIVAYSPF